MADDERAASPPSGSTLRSWQPQSSASAPSLAALANDERLRVHTVAEYAVDLPYLAYRWRWGLLLYAVGMAAMFITPAPAPATAVAAYQAALPKAADFTVAAALRKTERECKAALAADGLAPAWWAIWRRCDERCAARRQQCADASVAVSTAIAAIGASSALQ